LRADEPIVLPWSHVDGLGRQLQRAGILVNRRQRGWRVLRFGHVDDDDRGSPVIRLGVLLGQFHHCKQGGMAQGRFRSRRGVWRVRVFRILRVFRRVLRDFGLLRGIRGVRHVRVLGTIRQVRRVRAIRRVRTIWVEWLLGGQRLLGSIRNVGGVGIFGRILRHLGVLGRFGVLRSLRNGHRDRDATTCYEIIRHNKD